MVSFISLSQAFRSFHIYSLRYVRCFLLRGTCPGLRGRREASLSWRFCARCSAGRRCEGVRPRPRLNRWSWELRWGFRAEGVQPLLSAHPSQCSSTPSLHTTVPLSDHSGPGRSPCPLAPFMVHHSPSWPSGPWCPMGPTSPRNPGLADTPPLPWGPAFPGAPRKPAESPKQV